MRRCRIWTVFLLLASLVFLSGCGSKMHKIGGCVTYSDTGEPLEIGFVCFANGPTFARGLIKPDGTYTMGSFSENDGLPPGTYQVYVDGARKGMGKRHPDDDDEQYLQLIDLKHSRPETSGLTFVVGGKVKEFNITVDRAPAKR